MRAEHAGHRDEWDEVNDIANYTGTIAGIDDHTAGLNDTLALPVGNDRFNHRIHRPHTTPHHNTPTTSSHLVPPRPDTPSGRSS